MKINDDVCILFMFLCVIFVFCFNTYSFYSDIKQDFSQIKKIFILSSLDNHLLSTHKKKELKNDSVKKEYLSPYSGGDWHISSYYTPVEGQLSYFNGSYEKDYIMNCWGDCFFAANGRRLTEADTFQIVACDNSIYKLGTKFEITLPSNHPEHPNKTWTVTCVDTGGAVKGNHLDLWYGRGWKGQHHPWIGQFSTYFAKVKVL